jgi:glycosyltransferase involved in cell wall biosynthesis
MNILLVHNFYQQAGGEDQVFADETKLLRDRGHEVRQFTLHNDAVDSMGRLSLARRTLWNRESYDALRSAVREHCAQVVHFHNTFPLVSPAGYRAAHDEGAAVVQTLHNYRLLCPVATFFRDGHVCEQCLGKLVPWPGVAHRCYRNSASASAVVAAMLTVHRALRTWRDEVDVFIALTEFSRSKFVEGGLDPEKVIVKPNFVDPDPGVGDGSGGYALFVGRLTEEKGVLTLLRAWQNESIPVPLQIVGDGPLRAQVEAATRTVSSRMEYLGRQPLERVCAIMGSAGVLVFPSQWYEGLPRTIVESFAKGTPVIASRLGSMAELVEDGCTGRLFEPGRASDLARCVTEVFANQTDSTTAAHQAMRRNARLEYERNYTADRNYPLLMSAYQKALGKAEPTERSSSASARQAQQAQGETTPPGAASLR